MNPYDILNILLSPDGYSNEFISISISNPTSIDLSKEENKFVVSFKNNYPLIKIKKFLKISVKVSSIILGEQDGILILENFPDIPIKYEWFFPSEKQ